jgi:arabinofuranosyltransferase
MTRFGAPERGASAPETSGEASSGSVDVSRAGPLQAADRALARSGPRLLVGCLLAALALLALKCAWVSDDAYITFRVVDNFLAGHGLRWNIAERVQAYTNPLWLAAMAAARSISGEVYFTSIALGIATTTLAALFLVTRVARDTTNAALALLVLCGSKAFVDYSTSGLENPLLHLALLGALAAAATRSSLALGLWTSAAALTRLDSLALLAPALVYGIRLDLLVFGGEGRAGDEGRRVARAAGRLAFGLAPLAAWEVFSLVYYGALTPNTAIAKLNTGLSSGELASQGFAYLADSLQRDPLTLAAIAAALVACLASRQRFALLVALGVALHLAYVVKVGGDFMSGRFLTAPLCVAAFVLARTPLPGVVATSAALATLAFAALTPSSPLRAPLDASRGLPPAEHVDASGIADERAYWFAASGLFSANRGLPVPPYRHVSRGHSLALRLRENPPPAHLVEGIGYLGYWAGPHPHLVDPMGLSDGFLARLPIVVGGALVRPDKNAFRERAWRVGHYYRDVPEGYLELLRGEPASLADPELQQLYDDVALLTRGELFTRERWSAIARRLF